MNTKRADSIYQELQIALTTGAFGPSGSYFITVRDLAKRHACSFSCALEVLQKLIQAKLIYKVGKRYYLTTGKCVTGTPFDRYLANTNRQLFGVLLTNGNNPFFGSLMNHLQSIAARNGQNLILAYSNGDPKQESDILDMFLDLKCKGVFNCVPILKQQAPRFRYYPLPVVTLAEESDLPNVDTILVNNYAAGKHVARHLLDCGCKSFAYITEDTYIASDLRLQGFRQHLHQKQHALPDEHIGIISTEGGAVNTRDVTWFVSNLLHKLQKTNASLPLGIFCVHDLLAVETERIIKHRNPVKYDKLMIPKDVMIVGFDDLPISSLVIPSLTSVSYQYSSMAEKAYEVMIDYVKNPQHTPSRYEVNSSLTVRESTLSH